MIPMSNSDSNINIPNMLIAIRFLIVTIKIKAIVTEIAAIVVATLISSNHHNHRNTGERGYVLARQGLLLWLRKGT